MAENDTPKRIPRRKPFSIRLGPSEREEIEDAAWRRQLRVSDFVRQSALLAARRVLADES